MNVRQVKPAQLVHVPPILDHPLRCRWAEFQPSSHLGVRVQTVVCFSGRRLVRELVDLLAQELVALVAELLAFVDGLFVFLLGILGEYGTDSPQQRGRTSYLGGPLRSDEDREHGQQRLDYPPEPAQREQPPAERGCVRTVRSHPLAWTSNRHRL